AGSPVGKPSILKRWNRPCQFIFDHRPKSREGREANGPGRGSRDAPHRITCRHPPGAKVLVIILCLAADAWALDSATTTGFATAGRANPKVASVHESAPATMAPGQQYTVGATGAISQTDELGFRIEGMDSETAAFALGISYVRHDELRDHGRESPRVADTRRG